MCNRVFNAGLGMVLIVSPENKDAIMQSLREAGEQVYIVGQLSDKIGEKDCVIRNMEVWNQEAENVG